MRALLVPLLLVLLLLSGSARAEEALRLDFRREAGAEACPDEQDFRDALTAHIRRQLIDPSSTSKLVVRLQAKAGWYRGVASLRDPSGSASWTISLGPIPRDCAAVAENLALAIAIKIDPAGKRKAPTIPPHEHRLFGVDGELPAMPDPPAPQPPIPLPPTPPPPPRDAPPPPPPRDPEQRVRLGAAAGIALGALPSLAPIVSVDVGVRWRDLPLSVALEGSVATPMSADLQGSLHVVHVTAFRGTGAGIACGHFLRFLFACGRVALGAVHATGIATGLVAQPATVFYGGLGPRVGAEFPLGTEHLLARVFGDVLFTLGRPELQAGGASVWEASLVSGTAGGGLAAAF